MKSLEIKLGADTLYIETKNSNGNTEILVSENNKCKSLIYLNNNELKEVIKFLVQQL